MIFCGGFMSDMTGTKATALEDACRAAGRAYTRFDYRGHGQSSGDFKDGTIGAWRDDAVAVLDQVTTGPQVIVGSSMGGWIMLLLARMRPERIAGLVGIAPAPDFVIPMWESFSPEEQEILKRERYIERPTEYGDEPYIIAMDLIEEGRNHLLLGQAIPAPFPVRILQGMADPDVPWRHALDIVDKLDGPDIALTLIKQGDHRLSEPDDIARLIDMVINLASG